MFLTGCETPQNNQLPQQDKGLRLIPTVGPSSPKWQDFIKTDYDLPIPQDSIPAGVPDEVRSQILRLYSRNAVERIDAIERLGRIGENAAASIPFMVSLLADDTFTQQGEFLGMRSGETVRGAAGKALASCLGQQGLRALLLAFHNEDPKVREGAVWAVGQRDIADEQAIASITDSLSDPNIAVRRWAAMWFAHLVSTAKQKGTQDLSVFAGAVPPLAAAVHSDDMSLREEAFISLRELGKLTDSSLFDELVRFFNDARSARDGSYTIVACSCLGKTRDHRATQLLTSLLKDDLEKFKANVYIHPASAIRGAAADALGELVDIQAVDDLITMMLDIQETTPQMTPDKRKQNRFAIQAAANALQKITGENLGNDPDTWRKWWDKNKTRFDKTVH